MSTPFFVLSQKCKGRPGIRRRPFVWAKPAPPSLREMICIRDSLKKLGELLREEGD